jgi:molybdate transport system substrate-binding protein
MMMRKSAPPSGSQRRLAMTSILAGLIAAALPLSGSAVFAAELKVLSGNGPRAAVRELCEQFEKATGNKIALRFGVNPEVKSKIEAGESFDVVIGNPPIVDALIKDKLVVAPRVDFGRAGIGVAVKSGAAKPDISSVEAFKQALLKTKAVAFPGKGASGIYFVSLLDRMGIAAEMKSKLKPMEAEDTVEVVARGEADMVVVVATRIVDVPGVDAVGPIPQELQTHIGFAAGLSSAAKEPEAAKALIAFLSAPGAAATLKAKGVEPHR